MFLKPILPVLEYVVLYDYIKNELCVNKEKPQMKCNGKCHLAKEMGKASDSENGKEKSHSFSVEYQVVFFQKFQFANLLVFTPENVLKLFSNYSTIYTSKFTDFLFRPPLF